jgi:hypothetical protein
MNMQAARKRAKRAERFRRMYFFMPATLRLTGSGVNAVGGI